LAPVLLLLVTKLFPRKHWVFEFRLKAALGLGLTVTLLVSVSRHPEADMAIMRME
jgi:hypothetical protein